MHIKEAIKILEDEVPEYMTRAALRDAHKLGIEALKSYQKAQECDWYPPGWKLPGETVGRVSNPG